ncbi:hypothetical protein BGZ63DRAFT_452327 [Mariannaea sp. PMI_226]|nr:hypothetical protein BGZ63DRAFT_452327 [Mariannaea sp. PMI_226]
MSFYNDAAKGILTQPTLDEYRRASNFDINAPSAEAGNGTLGLTALALAAKNGHMEVVRLLLGSNADPDGLSSQHRTPLWIVTMRGRGDNRAEIVSLLLQYHAKPDYCHNELQNGSTPLVNELKQLKDPEVVRLLVDKNGRTEAAVKLAADLADPEIDDAMLSNQQRSKFRSAIIDLISALILFILAWANSPAMDGIANKVFKKFQIRGNKDSNTAKKIAEEVPEPKSKEEFKESINTFVEKHRLHKFFPANDSPLLETLVSKAVDLQNDDTSVLGQSTNTENLVKFALYQPIIYCDDSGSMHPDYNEQKEDRMADQADLVRRIASICTQVVPEDHGVHLRFINQELPHANDLRLDHIQDLIPKIQPSGPTEIGTNLRNRILEPFLYGKTMTRPLFISIITDGVPSGPRGSPEKRNTLRDEIIRCQDYLLTNGLPTRSVVFQLSQIGSDPSSKAFLEGLANDPRLENVYVTAQQLDSKFRELRGNERDLEAWLFQTLLTPVLDSRSD